MEITGQSIEQTRCVVLTMNAVAGLYFHVSCSMFARDDWVRIRDPDDAAPTIGLATKENAV